MMRRIQRDFAEAKGFAAPRLIIIWLAVGVLLFGIGLHLSIPGVDSYSGVVASIHTETEDGLRITLKGLPFDFFFPDTEFSPLPDVRVSDDVKMLTQSGFVVDDQAGRPVVIGLAVESARGTWTASIDGDIVAPYTPSTWPVHEAIRWMLFALGIGFGGVGLTSLFRWIPSRSSAVAPVGTEVSARGAVLADAGYPPERIRELVEKRPALSSSPTEQPAWPRLASPAGITAGWWGLLTMGVVEVVAIGVGGHGYCGTAPGWTFVVLSLVPLALGGTGVTTLVQASRVEPGNLRTRARVFAVTAIVLTLLSAPLNLVAALSWSVCIS